MVFLSLCILLWGLCRFCSCLQQELRLHLQTFMILFIQLLFWLQPEQYPGIPANNSSDFENVGASDFDLGPDFPLFKFADGKDLLE